MEDTIKLKVNENGTWYEYNLSYEDFAYIQPVLDRCKDKKEVPLFDPSDPEAPMRLTQQLLLPMFQGNNKGFIYNLLEKPNGYTMDEVIEKYRKDNFLLVEGESIQTKQIM